MTKISFDVDFSKDPEKILKEIQERAKAEFAKRESKEKNSAYLSDLHNLVNKELGTAFKNTNDLIKALTPFSTHAFKNKLASTSASGRRQTVSMDQEAFDQIKELLGQANPNKAAIARETGVSVVQVRKVATGGYDKKYGSGALKEEAPAPAPRMRQARDGRMRATEARGSSHDAAPRACPAPRNGRVHRAMRSTTHQLPRPSCGPLRGAAKYHRGFVRRGTLHRWRSCCTPKLRIHPGQHTGHRSRPHLPPRSAGQAQGAPVVLQRRCAVSSDELPLGSREPEFNQGAAFVGEAVVAAVSIALADDTHRPGSTADVVSESERRKGHVGSCVCRCVSGGGYRVAATILNRRLAMDRRTDRSANSKCSSRLDQTPAWANSQARSASR